MYNIEKNYNKLVKDNYTFFLKKEEATILKGKIKKQNFNVFLPYPDSEKIILYTKSLPEIILYEICSTVKLKHQDILGSIYALKISDEVFGDIVIDDNKYYIYIFKDFQNYFEANFTTVKNSSITLKRLGIDFLKEYKRKYEEIIIVASSERIDTIISKIINISRARIENKIKDDEIMYNNFLLKRANIKLKVGDTFSIRKYGKFKFNGIIGTSKSKNYIISIYKYS